MDFLMAKLTANSKLCLIRSAKDAVIRYDKICRTCLSTNNVVSIFNVTYENSNFTDLLQQHVSIQVQEHDALPTQICDNCIAQLIHLHTFKKKCLQTQVTLDEIIKYHEALNLNVLNGTGIQSCNVIQVPFIFQEVLICQGNNQNEEWRFQENNQNEKFKGNNQNKEKVQKINLTKVVKNNNHGNDQNIRSKQSNSKVNSDKAISINDNTGVLQMEVIIGDDDTSFTLEDGNDEDWNQKVVLEKGNNNIAETEDKIINSEVNSEEVLEDINNIQEQKTAGKQEIEVQKEKRKLLSKLVCNICKEKFDTVDELKQHRKDTKHHIVRRSCHVCGKMVGGHMSSHLRTHTLERPYKCHVCHKAFSVGNNLQRHMKIHTGEKHFICEICGKGYARQDTFKEHKVTHTGEFPFTCDYCGRAFNHVLKLRFHVRRHEIKSGLINKMSKEEESKLTCEICHKIYSSRAILYTHKFVHGEKLFVCDECGKRFHTRVLLRCHQRVHTGEKPYSCKVCGKSLATQTSLKTHILIHTGEKPHSCKICSKSFKQITHLKHHMRTHSGEKPYKCDYCGKCFALKGNLTIHIRIHTGETPFVCEICDRGFHDSGTLKKHKRTQHSDH